MATARTVDQFQPMQALESLVKPFTSPDFIYEIKWDGYRTLAGCGRGVDVEMRTKRGAICTRWFEECVEALQALPGGPHVIDTEATVIDEIGRADFNRLHERAARRRWYKGSDQVTLCAFDILVFNGKEVIDRPLVERKELLRQLLENIPKKVLMYVGDFPADASLYQEVVLALKLEGFVAKRKDSTYQPGVRSADWRKIKRPNWQEGRKWR